MTDLPAKLDRAAAEQIRQRLLSADHDTFDLAGVEFVGLQALHVLMAARAEQRLRKVTNVDPALAPLLDLAGVPRGCGDVA